MRNNFRQSREEQGVALVTTVIVVAVLAVVAVAFMQSTTVDRLSSRSVVNYQRAKLAAESGLAEAMALIQSNAAGFTYVSGGEPQAVGYRTYIRPRSVAGGVWQFSGSRAYLDSGIGGELADLLVSGTNAADGVVVRAAYKTVSVTNNATNRYAFWVDDGSGKQNLSWWGGTDSDRGLLADITNAPLVLPSANGTTVAPMPGAALAELNSIRDYTVGSTNLFGQSTPFRSVSNGLPTPATFNLLDPGVQGRASRYFFALSSPSSATSPVGRRKLNLAQLARYLNSGISSAQGAAGLRAQIVDQLLQANPAQAANWGGGDLNWLATAGKYSTNEQRQIVANLLDYLDDDLIPTTDSETSPSYLGIESKLDSTGRVQGHPFVVGFGAGCVFNRQTGTGLVNSSRVLCYLTLANPWEVPINVPSWGTYTPEIEISVSGTAINGNLGSDAAAYFSPLLTNSPPGSGQTILASGKALTYPDKVGGSVHFASFNSFSQVNNRQPTNLAFQNLTYTFRKCRIRFTDTMGRNGYVQILPPGVAITAEPRTILAGGSGPLAIKFIFTEPASSRQKDRYLNTDPRLGFLASSWVESESINNDVPTPQPNVKVFAAAGPEADGPQGVQDAFEWFSSLTTNHFFRATNAGGLQSIGEIGYLWTGKPWQTLNLTRTNNPSTDDHNLLDYLAGGFTNGAAAYATMPLLAPSVVGPGVTESNSLLQDGGFNVLTRKLATVTAYLTNAPGISASAAAQLAALPPPELASLGGALAVMTNLSSATTTKFGREGIVRAMANGAVTQSRIFTVYSRGEYVSPGARSQALLEADVFVDVDPGSGTPVVRVVSMKFL